MVNCNYQANGCHGGSLTSASTFLKEFGTVKEECAPYTGKDQKCKHRHASKHCPLHKCKKVEWLVTEEDTKKEIMKNGPVVSQMIVFDDLYYYQKGIYEHVSGPKVSNHAITIVGWGEEEGVKYWRIANTWSDEWGDKGFFNIKLKDVGIASYSAACQV